MQLLRHHGCPVRYFSPSPLPRVGIRISECPTMDLGRDSEFKRFSVVWQILCVAFVEALQAQAEVVETSAAIVQRRERRAALVKSMLLKLQ